MKPNLHPVQRDANSRVHLISTVGHKWLTCVVLDYPVRVTQLPIEDTGLQPLTLHGELYPLKRAVRLFRRYSKDNGATESAQKALDTLKAALPA